MSRSPAATTGGTQVPDRRRPGRLRAAALLVVLTPLVAELALGSTPFRFAWVVLLLLPMYGFGILLVRELVRRTGRGWPSILLLGVAFEIVEDGIALQALSSPTLYGAAGWGPRVLGLNLTYWEMNAAYHVIFSAVLPILLVELAFPAHRNTPYLRLPGLVGTAVGWVLGVALVRVLIPPSADPGYTAPLPVLIGCAAAVVLLGVLVLRVLPRRRPAPDHPGRVPGLAAVALFGLVGALVAILLLFPHGDAGPLGTSGAWALVPMTAAAAVLVAAGLLVRRWAGAAAWTDRHALWLAGGALVAHTLFGLVANASTPVDRIGLTGVLGVTLLGVTLLDRGLRARDQRAPDQLRGVRAP